MDDEDDNVSIPPPRQAPPPRLPGDQIQVRAAVEAFRRQVAEYQNSNAREKRKRSVDDDGDEPLLPIKRQALPQPPPLPQPQKQREPEPVPNDYEDDALQEQLSLEPRFVPPPRNSWLATADNDRLMHFETEEDWTWCFLCTHGQSPEEKQINIEVGVLLRLIRDGAWSTDHSKLCRDVNTFYEAKIRKNLYEPRYWSLRSIHAHITTHDQSALTALMDHKATCEDVLKTIRDSQLFLYDPTTKKTAINREGTMQYKEWLEMHRKTLAELRTILKAVNIDQAQAANAAARRNAGGGGKARFRR